MEGNPAITRNPPSRTYTLFSLWGKEITSFRPPYISPPVNNLYPFLQYRQAVRAKRAPVNNLYPFLQVKKLPPSGPLYKVDRQDQSGLKIQSGRGLSYIEEIFDGRKSRDAQRDESSRKHPAFRGLTQLTPLSKWRKGGISVPEKQEVDPTVQTARFLFIYMYISYC